MDFTYPGTDRRVLHDVNFTLRQGETLAVVGINGAGKSTLVKLLLRFYDPTGGQILYNGKPLPEYDLEQLRGAFGTVFQDYKNFALSVNENVIGHACTTVQADEIYVMEQDRIIESGSHSELMAAGGTYAYMFRLQAEKYKNAKSE